MHQIDLVELHSPLFLGGKNFKTRLDVKEHKGLILQYDDKTKRLWVEYGGKACFFGIEGSVHPRDPSDFGYELTTKTLKSGPIVTHTPQPMVSGVARTAQVETPMSRPPQAPGPRTAKYQGQ